jgi:hypothetical protein
MQAITWQQFGLRKNPYNTRPLVEGGELPIEKAFIGRMEERKFLDDLFQSENNICLAICGNVGVGKTSLANFHKFIWKYQKNKLLFSFRREIEACADLLDKHNFLLEIIGSVLREIELVDPKLLKNNLLKKLKQIIDFTQSIAISGGISGGISGISLGGNIGKETSVNPPLQLSTSTLEKYFLELINFIKENLIMGQKYEGLIIHVNNFDVVLSEAENKKKVINFFNEMRDILQTPDTYFLFLGPNNLFKDIISSQKRVKGIFYPAPLRINPLNKKEIIIAFDERMNLLQSKGVVHYVKPIDDQVIFRLYDLYEGDIRSIMSSIRAILSQCSDKIAKSLTIDESMLLLGKAKWENIEACRLTEEQKEILKYLSVQEKISQKEVSVLFKKARTNMSGYYFKPLRENGIIEEKEKIGNTPYWGLSPEYIPLKWLVESQKKIQKTIKQKTNQLKLFEN